MNEEMILVTVKRFRELQRAELKLEALYQHGVDNWGGYGEAMETLEEWKNENEI